MKLNRIKAVLSEKGISQTWLAKQLDKSFSMVNAYACNRIQPNLETLQRIAEILQVDLKDLITDKKGKTTIEFKAISVVLDVFNLYKIENTLNVRILNSKIKML